MEVSEEVPVFSLHCLGDSSLAKLQNIFPGLSFPWAMLYFQVTGSFQHVYSWDPPAHPGLATAPHCLRNKAAAWPSIQWCLEYEIGIDKMIVMFL